MQSKRADCFPSSQRVKERKKQKRRSPFPDVETKITSIYSDCVFNTDAPSGGIHAEFSLSLFFLRQWWVCLYSIYTPECVKKKRGKNHMKCSVSKSTHDHVKGEGEGSFSRRGSVVPLKQHLIFGHI